MSKLVLTAEMKAKEGCLETMLIEAKKLIALTRNEQGCIVYELLSNNENKHVYMFHEVWASEEDWKRHMESAHLVHFLNTKDEYLDDLKLGQWNIVN
ncbi:MAG: putative quinol monooxygenase [Bacteroidales bacterium]